MEALTKIVPRYEYKYRIPSTLASEVEREVRRYCESDPWSADGPYLISSLYLDSPRRFLYRQSRSRRPKRMKLRVRRYEVGPFFLEIKHRDGRVITKTRVPLHARSWPNVLTDPTEARRTEMTPNEQRKLEEFVSRCLGIHAEPAVIIRYRRQAYASRVDRYARVTIDRRLQALAPRGYKVPIGDDAGWVPFDDPDRMGTRFSSVLLELKCTTSVPLWMTDIVVQFGLHPLGFSKYATGLEATTPFLREVPARQAPQRYLAGGTW
jgi:hypothetical protein